MPLITLLSDLDTELKKIFLKRTQVLPGLLWYSGSSTYHIQAVLEGYRRDPRLNKSIMSMKYFNYSAKMICTACTYQTVVCQIPIQEIIPCILFIFKTDLLYVSFIFSLHGDKSKIALNP